ncbi:DUF4747 family protein [Iodobacter sp. CM08]|uniref:DUF4747 family protein n=1 Tax=Iodobacter sp. CM08 TaxID=3085902 RepID=UPI002981687D|nr:DUF4747 family protein [Iodobacter sp. CM08]MDW5418882.1 DUF4747 family protein [Iodobacter sp. CM08]
MIAPSVNHQFIRFIFTQTGTKMSRLRSIKIAALNIAMHNPHSQSRYISLFQDASSIQHFVRLGTLHAAMLGPLVYENKDDPTLGFTGEIYRFVAIDPSEPWFNSKTKDAASEDEIKGVNIPEHLLPHLQTIPFLFKPDIHELWFVSKDRKHTFGPQLAVSFFTKLFTEVCRIKQYPIVEVTALPNIETLNELLTIPKLEKLTIELKRPNADDADSDEERWMKKLQKQKASKMNVEFVASPGESIVPDLETKTLAGVAARNGKVSVIGRTASGKRVEESTESHPLVQTTEVNPQIETVMSVLKRIASFG